MSSLSSMGVDPSAVPYRSLANGDRMPAIGLGTFGSDRYTAQDVASAVSDAIAQGYRHIDCAAIYGNEPEIGQALRAAMATGVRREDLWITSKLWNDMHAPADVIPAFERSLRDLGLEYLDLYLIHWPFPNHHSKGCTVTARSVEAKPYIHDAYMAIWRQLEGLVKRGLVRHIGCSNMTIPKLKLLLRDATIPPAANEMELHPHFQQPGLFDFVTANGIIPIGYSPLGSPSRPERDRTADDSVDLEDPVIVAIAERLGIHAAQVCLAWAVQRGQVAIPFSVHRSKYLANLQAVVTARLTSADMAAIAGIDRNCRLIKGQVFLWKDGQTWQDLWDEHGYVTPA